MADEPLTLKLHSDVSALLREAAALAGEAPEIFAERLLVHALETDRWAISEARFDEYKRTGMAEDADAVFQRVRDRILHRLAEKA
jgi:hypothetical protein